MFLQISARIRYVSDIQTAFCDLIRYALVRNVVSKYFRCFHKGLIRKWEIWIRPYRLFKTQSYFCYFCVSYVGVCPRQCDQVRTGGPVYAQVWCIFSPPAASRGVSPVGLSRMLPRPHSAAATNNVASCGP